MEAYTLTRGFLREAVVDVFDSFIWTERYFGDSDVEITLPATPSNISLLAKGKFLQLDGAKEPMMLEEHYIEKGLLKVTGISLLKWMNNRFIRKTAAHEDRYWNISGLSAGVTMGTIVFDMLVSGGPVGVTDPGQFLIPGLTTQDLDATGGTITVAVPYGPVYDALYELATTYQVGMKIILEYANSGGYHLGFYAYRGVDRSSIQGLRPVVRFSPDMESLTDIKELSSIAGYKTIMYVWAPANPGGLATDPGVASYSSLSIVGPPTSGWDVRAGIIFADDITTDLVGGSSAVMQSLLTERAESGLSNAATVAQVDGEIVPTSQFKYGRDYNLGDIIEVAGYSGVVQPARVTEYVRSQDASGEKAYPGLTLIV
jgi:Siphovirus ReqiPepy6 Gp37-like protein